MNADREHPLVRVAKYAPIAEKIAFGALTIGVLLEYAGVGGMPVILCALALLAVAFFLAAYIPRPLPEVSGPKSFGHLLVFIIMPKFVMLGSAVSTFGIFAFLMNFGNKGYLQPLMIGATVTLMAFLIYLYGVIKSMDGVNALLPPFYRAIPFAILATYIFIQNRN